MSSRLLITTFTTWLPHQPSNAADDLIDRVAQAGLPIGTELLRHLPVDSQESWAIVQAAMRRFRPTRIIACGMAESRDRLSLEQQAVCGDRIQRTTLDLAAWAVQLEGAELSCDAGDFVCNDLYFSILEALAAEPCWQDTRALFVHVPPLVAVCPEMLVRDFQRLLQLLADG
jgi:pyroglutamyl-peptidase